MVVMNTDTDAIVSITIPLCIYEKLVRDSETLNIIRRFVEADQYATAKDIKVLLGLEEGEKA